MSISTTKASDAAALSAMVHVVARESHIDAAVRRALPGGPIGYRDRHGILFMAKIYIEALPDHEVTTEFVEAIRREWRKGYPFP